MIENHFRYTDSLKAAEILNDWDENKQHFVKVYPREYHKMLDATEEMRQAGFTEEEVLTKAFEAVVGTQLSIPAVNDAGAAH